MKSSNLVEAIFLATGIVLVVLVVLVDCLQGLSPVKLFGVLACNYGLTSSDFRVKILAIAILAIFAGLLFGPILAVLRRPERTKRSKRPS